MEGLVKYERGRGHVELRQMPEPEVRPGHVIIEVAACGICGTDLHILDDEYSSSPPVILGHEFSGVIAEVGSNVSQFQAGDRVVAMPFFSVCGICRYCRTGNWNLCPSRASAGVAVNGGFARYVLMPERSLFRVPDYVDLITAALTEPLTCCVRAIIEKTRINPGDFVLVLGPGPIGLLALQLAKAWGARTLVCGTSQDGSRLKLAESLGADHVLNIQHRDIIAFLREQTAGEGVDVVLECSGNGSAAAMGVQALRRQGQFTQIGLYGKPLQLDLDQFVYKEVQFNGSFSSGWTSWKKSIELISQKLVQLQPLVSDILPLSRWEEGFKKCQSKDGVKVLLTPS